MALVYKQGSLALCTDMFVLLVTLNVENHICNSSILYKTCLHKFCVCIFLMLEILLEQHYLSGVLYRTQEYFTLSTTLNRVFCMRKVYTAQWKPKTIHRLLLLLTIQYMVGKAA